MNQSGEARMAAKLHEALILVCIDQALQEAERCVGRGNRGAADWWFNKGDAYTEHLLEVRAFYARLQAVTVKRMTSHAGHRLLRVYGPPTSPPQ